MAGSGSWGSNSPVAKPLASSVPGRQRQPGVHGGPGCRLQPQAAGPARWDSDVTHEEGKHGSDLRAHALAESTRLWVLIGNPGWFRWSDSYASAL